jgi:hypothetical protein
MLHLTSIAAPEPEDAFGLHRGLLFGWDESLSRRAQVFGHLLAEEGLTAPLVMGAIGGLASMLAAHWQAECGRPQREADRRADQFTTLAHGAWREAAQAIVASAEGRLPRH